MSVPTRVEKRSATKHDPDEIIARYGAAAGQRLIDAAEQGPVVLAELIKRHGIDCGYAVPGIVMAAHSEQALRAHAKRVEYWQARGRPVELLDRRQAADMISPIGASCRRCWTRPMPSATSTSRRCSRW
jgi:hypothetical protein